MVFNFSRHSALGSILDKEKIILDKFEDYLLSNLPVSKSFHPHFEDALCQMLKAGGKRFRPLLLLSVVDACEPLLLKNAFSVAFAIELLHTYSLIHDDLPSMDDADLRRGHTTLHVLYDEVTAVLAGDALNTYSFFVLTDAPLDEGVKIRLIKELSHNGGIGGMIIGQAVDCQFENKKLTIEELKFLHIHKTAKLIAASLKMGAVIAGLGREKEDTLFEFGEKLGLLFQVEDDIIDATQSSDEAGKPTNNDTVKNSFVNLLGIDGANEEKKRLIEELKKDLKVMDEQLADRLRRIIDKYFKF